MASSGYTAPVDDPYSRFADGRIDVPYRHTFSSRNAVGVGFPEILVDLQGLTFFAAAPDITVPQPPILPRGLLGVGFTALGCMLAAAQILPLFSILFSIASAVGTLLMASTMLHSAPSRLWWRLHADPHGVTLDRLTGPRPTQKRILDRTPQKHGLEPHGLEGTYTWDALEEPVLDGRRLRLAPLTLPPVEATDAVLTHLVGELASGWNAYHEVDRSPSEADRRALKHVRRLLTT